MRDAERLAFLRVVASAFAVGIAYWALAKFSLALPVKDSGISYIWPADGVAVGALLCVRRRYWPLFLAAVFLGNFTASNKPLELNLLYSSFQVMEAYLIARVLRAILGASRSLDSLRRAMQMAVGILGAGACAIFASSAIDWLIHRGDFWHVYGVWYVSDTLGILVVAPLVLSVMNEWRVEWGESDRWRRMEGVVAVLAMCVVTYAAFNHRSGAGQLVDVALTPLAFPAILMLWTSTRFGMPGGMITVTIFMFTAFRYTAAGEGPFVEKWIDPRTALVHLQITLTLIALLVIVVAARTVEWRRALAESQVSRKRLEFAIEASDMVVFETDGDTGEIHWSGDTTFALGIAPKGLADVAAWRERLHPEDRGRVRHLHAQLQAGVRPFLTLDYRLRRDDGEYVTVAADAYAVPPEGARPYERRATNLIGVLRNVTRSRRLDAEKARLEERLRQAEKLEAIGGLAGGVAHDFNNILGAILGYAEMLQERTEPGTKARKYADTIAAAGGRGKSLVAKILAFSRVSDAKKQPVDLRHLIDEVGATLRGSLPPGITLQIALPEEPVAVFGNATDLYQVAMNLCTNGAQAMPAGGELRMSLETIEVEGERVLYSGPLAHGAYACLTVEDQGVGIPDTVLPRIFEPFFTTKGRNKGTGLGLAIAHGVTLAHGGAIDVASELGVGTRVSVFLPLHQGDVPEEDSATGELPRGRGQTVLVVDDEPHLVELAQDMLAELGYEPVGFTSSGRALAAITLSPDRFDAVVSDEVMPDLTGSELCARLRAQGFPRPVILVSGYGGPGFESRAHSVGATRVVRKPYRRRELAVALADALAPRQDDAMSAQSTATSLS
jgi:signal transduction histidine kinase/CheY-like chemotaxis protein